MQSKNLKNIIVVDDDRSIRVVISTALTRAGYNVKSSGTAAGMRRLVESDFADIIITDVGLPDGDALDVLPKLQHMKPKLKIIVMSARTTLLTAVRAKKKGAFEYLPKPFDLDELLNLVSNTFSEQNNIEIKDFINELLYDYYNNEVKNNWHNPNRDGLSNLEFDIHSSTKSDKVTHLIVSI